MAGDALPVPQPVSAPLTRAAIFLVVTINPGAGNCAAVRSFCADLPAILRAVEFRDLEAGLSCVMGFGSEAWDRLFGAPRPAELHPFREIRAGRAMPSRRRAICCSISAPSAWICASSWRRRSWRGSATRSRRSTRCTAFATSTTAICSASSTARKTRAARRRSMPRSSATRTPAFAGGSYVIVQKYLHDLAGWNALSDRGAGTHHRPHQALRHRAGRCRQADLRAQCAHHDRRERQGDQDPARQHALRPGRQGEFGTYFIGYSRSPRTIEQMLENMFVGRPPGNYDRLLDFSRAVTGNLFFVPSATFLDDVAADEPAPATAAAPPAVEPAPPVTPVPDGSLGIGSLKGDTRHE